MIRQLPKRFLKGLVRIYQLTLSPFIGRQCRFEPTCSYYALEALEEHGALRGTWLAVKRVARCHPFHPGGFDPVEPVHGAARQTAQEET
ncbi:MAG: membrane protein insertion efficiency factor YidD [Gammaproteobacteria bacterium]|nr:membrane protein insertion efficiency factor YidD [Gammaproteobacteria bacterium]